MSLNRSLSLLCSCKCLPAVSGVSGLSVGALPRASLFTTSRSSSRTLQLRRRYATVRDSKSARDDVPDWPTTQYPSPYDIFGMKKDEPYTKRRFYELVKLYHPDKHGHTPEAENIPHATRLERYRLVVAANDLLSDPSKRHLYDTHGVGWSGGRPQTINETMRQADRSWRHREGSAAQNATWEDWERWYDARDGKTRDPLYMSNGLFATVVVMMCMIGAFAQMSRAEASGAEYLEAKNQTDLAIGQQMARRGYSAAGRSKDERVNVFLRDRENLNFQFQPSKYEDVDSVSGDAAMSRAK